MADAGAPNRAGTVYCWQQAPLPFVTAADAQEPFLLRNHPLQGRVLPGTHDPIVSGTHSNRVHYRLNAVALAVVAAPAQQLNVIEAIGTAFGARDDMYWPDAVS
ncbi:MAG: hypothetical protein JWN98_2441 [Abditibacteriota bacterium]|nr:hypothetical protein [Abditibacteriota bacterium]